MGEGEGDDEEGQVCGVQEGLEVARVGREGEGGHEEEAARDEEEVVLDEEDREAARGAGGGEIGRAHV